MSILTALLYFISIQTARWPMRSRPGPVRIESYQYKKYTIPNGMTGNNIKGVLTTLEPTFTEK